MNKYYSLNTNKNEADIYIFGDITSWEWLESDVSSYTLSKEISGLDVDTINVYINSYGGEVAEGLAIYNMLKQHKAKIKTYCAGFACSIASVIFMAGDERIMYDSSFLMIHNAWTVAVGNSGDMRKAADDLDIISSAAVQIYKNAINIDEEELQQMLDDETWIIPGDALEMQFATSIISTAVSNKTSQSARKSAYSLMTNGIIGAEKLMEYVKISSKEREEPLKQTEPKENNTIKFLQAMTGKGE